MSLAAGFVANAAPVSIAERLTNTVWELKYLDTKMAYTETHFLPDGVCVTYRKTQKWVTKWWISKEGELIFTSGRGTHHTFPHPNTIGGMEGSFPVKGRLKLVFIKKLKPSAPKGIR